MSANSFGASLNASYEVDFWGKARANLRSAEESLKSAMFSQQVVALTVTAAVANTYLDVLALRQRVTIADRNIKAANRILVDHRGQGDQRRILAPRSRPATGAARRPEGASTSLARIGA